MDKIIDNLYLGDITAVEDEGALRRAKVSHILSVTMRQAPYPHGVDVNTKKIEVEDDPSVNLISYFQETNIFIGDGINGEGCVLVHCDAGISRSVTIVAAYLIQSHNHTPESALALIRSRRAYVRPNRSYIEQLGMYHEFGCDASLAAQKWTQRQAELADMNGKARRNPAFFIAYAGPRLLGWIHRKVRRPPSERNRHERVKAVESDS